MLNVKSTGWSICD